MKSYRWIGPSGDVPDLGWVENGQEVSEEALKRLRNWPSRYVEEVKGEKEPSPVPAKEKEVKDG